MNVETISGQEWAGRLRACVPVVLQIQRSVKGCDPTAVLNAALWFAAKTADHAGITEEVFLRYARQFFAVSRGARTGSMGEELARVAVREVG